MSIKAKVANLDELPIKFIQLYRPLLLLVLNHTVDVCLFREFCIPKNVKWRLYHIYPNKNPYRTKLITILAFVYKIMENQLRHVFISF